MYQKLLALVLTLVIFQTAFAQSPTAKKPDEAEAEFKKQTLLFLRETAGELNNLRSVENRISFASELAGLMWFEDEKEARAMFLNVSSDFKQLVMNYDSQLSQIELSSVDDDGGSGGGGGLLFGGDDSDKGKLERKMRIAMMVRQQVASSIAEHDPQLAFDFYYDSINAIANVARRKQYEGQDKYFEGKLLSEIAEKDAAKAAEMGRRSLANGVMYYHVELLKKIYAKDADKGAEFAEALASKLKDQSSDSDNNSILSSVLSTGIDNFEKTKKEGRKKKPMFTEQGLRDLSELLAQKLLEMDAEQGSSAMMYVGMIEKYAPGRAVQIKSKFGRGSGNGEGTGMGVGSAYGNSAVRIPKMAPDSYTVSGNSNTAMPRAETEADRARAEKQKADEQLMTDVAGLSSKKLPKEERDKVVAQARKIVSEMKGKDEKIMALSMLAAQVAKAGDKELASEIMKDAHALINPQPKNYKDFMYVWMLASGYAEADPEKAFPLLEDAILRLNDTITGVVRVAEFIDVAGEVIDDGEVQVGAFGGSMIRGMTQGLGLVNPTLRSLARADMAKTKGLTNSFDRPEVRVLAKMLFLRAIMSKDKQPGEGEEDGFAGPGVLDSN